MPPKEQNLFYEKFQFELIKIQDLLGHPVGYQMMLLKSDAHL